MVGTSTPHATSPLIRALARLRSIRRRWILGAVLALLAEGFLLIDALPLLSRERMVAGLLGILALAAGGGLVALAMRLAQQHAEIRALATQLQRANEELEWRIARGHALEESNSRLVRLAERDPLTGIANRRRLGQVLDTAWRSSARGRRSIAILLVDIDEFKRFNDHYGHPSGDDCLQRVAQALSSALHRPGDFLARFGGEEFVAILPQTDLAGARHVAERMVQAIDRLAIAHQASCCAQNVTISVGGAVTLPDPATPPKTLLAAADQALYAAKRAGRHRAKVHEVTLPKVSPNPTEPAPIRSETPEPGVSAAGR